MDPCSLFQTRWTKKGQEGGGTSRSHQKKDWRQKDPIKGRKKGQIYLILVCSVRQLEQILSEGNGKLHA
jgi:hypothetical protein